MSIAQSSFSFLSHMWTDHRLLLSMKLRLYKTAVCSTFTHACGARDMTDEVKRMINEFNSRFLHVITKIDYRETAINLSVTLILLILRRRIRYLRNILRMDTNRLVRQTFIAYVNGGYQVPNGSLHDDCNPVSVEDLFGDNRSRQTRMGTESRNSSLNML